MNDNYRHGNALFSLVVGLMYKWQNNIIMDFVFVVDVGEFPDLAPTISMFQVSDALKFFILCYQ